MTILCLASPRTAAIVKASAENDKLHHVNSVKRAMEALEKRHYTCLVAALGTQAESYIFPEKKSHHSPLLSFAAQYRPSMARIVYSKHACSHHSVSRLCLESGAADAVVSSPETFLQAWRTLVRPSSPGEQKDALSLMTPLDQRRKRERQLLSASNCPGDIKTVRVRILEKTTKRLEDQYSRSVSMGPKSTNGKTLKVVHVSDTHNMHRFVQLPEQGGDLFLHTGDICANYHGKANVLVDQFQDFLSWLHDVVCPIFKKVVFIAGNHDIYLDPTSKMCSSGEYKLARKCLDDFLLCHANVSYLENASTHFCGLHIYGTPIMTCRKESMGKRYFSNAFEKPQAERLLYWQMIPSDVDILLTHMPPTSAHGLYRSTASADLTQALQQSNKNGFYRYSPSLHAFGHDHRGFGILRGESGRPLYSNGSQEKLLQDDMYGGGTSLVFDLACDPVVSCEICYDNSNHSMGITSL
uniref:Calcineurin-like phosphoesterase domain-containing protein n=1 Tax=Ditylum brightwellii TaxID=49249 RepID=A0A6U3TKS0_9STRA|mmetsp:Transcript_39551/g.59413  ORF Transcript_39551/g.59413 Transcript_39551/m.59413 type:complete len:468 (+) Transcript_39551:65-1468(+)